MFSCKYAFRIQNPNLFIDCSLENGIAVENADIAFTTCRIWLNRLAKSFAVIGWAGKVFIRY